MLFESSLRIQSVQKKHVFIALGRIKYFLKWKDINRTSSVCLHIVSRRGGTVCCL